MKHNLFIAAFAIVAVAASVVFFSAFKSYQPVKAQLEAQWFQYNGEGSPTDASSYSNPSASPSGCEGVDEICSIRAVEGSTSGQPDMTSSLISEINAALNNPAGNHANVKFKEVEQ